MTTPIFPSVIGHNLLDGGTDAQDGNNYPGPLLQEYAAAVVGAAGLVQMPVTVRPYRIATFGDSRINSGSTGPAVSGSQLLTTIRTPMWFAAHMGDAEIVRNYGVSGDTAVSWNLSSRTGGKTFSDLNVSDVDAVLIQYGVNDAMAGTAAATIFAALKALVTEVIKSGKIAIFESINPVRAPATNAAASQVIVDAVNALMQSWMSSFARQAIYVDTATALKSADGFANTTYYNADGIHFVQAGAYLAGKMIAAAVRSMLPRRTFAFLGPDNKAPNLLNLVSPSAYGVAESGTATISISSGQDADGYYTEWLITPTALASGECRVRCELSANFQTSAQPAYALLGNEVLQGSARVRCDNGGGGAPNAYSVTVRQRFYTASLFRDWGIIPPGGVFADLVEPLDVQAMTPAFENTAASVVANPGAASGYQLSAFVSSQTVGIPVRLRLYNPQLRRIGYSGAPLAQTVPSSAAAYTNTSQSNQMVIVAGGTVSAIAINSVATGLTSGTFVLAPGDTLTPTYTVAPTTFVAKQF